MMVLNLILIVGQFPIEKEDKVNIFKHQSILTLKFSKQQIEINNLIKIQTRNFILAIDERFEQDQIINTFLIIGVDDIKNGCAFSRQQCQLINLQNIQSLISSSNFIIIKMIISSTAQILLLLAILSLASGQYDCKRVFKAGPPKIESLETGHFSIKATNPTTRYNWFRYPLKQKYGPGRIDVGLSITYIDGYLDTTSVDFSIRPIVKQSYFDVVFAINVKASWTYAHVHFLATNRDDFTTGTFVASAPGLFEPTGPAMKVVQITSFVNLSNADAWRTLQKTRQVGATTYISGIKCDDLNFNMKLKPYVTYYHDGKITIFPEISSNKMPIEILYITYFVYSYVGRVTTWRYPSNYDFLYKTIVGQDDGEIGVAGMTGVNAASLRQYIQQVSQAPKRLLGDFPVMNMSEMYKKMTPRQIFRYKKVFQINDFGIRPAPPLDMILRSTLPPENIKNMVQNNICIGYDGCKESGGQIVAKQTKMSCVICPANKTFSQKTLECQCKDPLIHSGDQCVEPNEFCGVGKFFQKGNCFQMIKVKQFCDKTKNQMFDEDSKKCVCPPDHKLTPTMQGAIVCAPTCPEGTVVNFENFTCKCPEGSYMKQNKCHKCGSMEVWSDVKLECECKPGTVLTKRRQCILCSPLGVINEQKGICQCLPGYYGNGVICRVLKPLIRNATASEAPPVSNGGITVLNDNPAKL